jgi:hypothetical protein
MAGHLEFEPHAPPESPRLDVSAHLNRVCGWNFILAGENTDVIKFYETGADGRGFGAK